MKHGKPQNSLCDVAREIINIKFTPKTTLRKCYNKFYQIMRKHNIKQCTADGKNAMRCDNYEWTICHVLFLERLNSYMDLVRHLEKVMETPKDLLV